MGEEKIKVVSTKEFQDAFNKALDEIKETARQEGRVEGAIASEIKVILEFKEILNKLEVEWYEWVEDLEVKYPKFLLDKRIELNKRLKELKENKEVN